MSGRENINPALVERRRIDQLLQDPNNCRSHNDRNLSEIKHSLHTFGQQKPIVIDEHGKVIAGNGTALAAAELGWEWIAVVVTSIESERDRVAFGIADNRASDFATWDDDALISAAKEWGADVLVGFNDDETQAIIESFASGAHDVPKPEASFVVRFGVLDHDRVGEFRAAFDNLVRDFGDVVEVRR